jgi:hypothetical protein
LESGDAYAAQYFLDSILQIVLMTNAYLSFYRPDANPSIYSDLTHILLGSAIILPTLHMRRLSHRDTERLALWFGTARIPCAIQLQDSGSQFMCSMTPLRRVFLPVL